jgi:hypothetical protein
MRFNATRRIHPTGSSQLPIRRQSTYAFTNACYGVSGDLPGPRRDGQAPHQAFVVLIEEPIEIGAGRAAVTDRDGVQNGTSERTR